MILLTKVIWYQASNPSLGINLTGALNMNIGRGLDIRNNTVQISLKNEATSMDENGNLEYEYVNANNPNNPEGTLRFEQRDQIKVYVKYTDDMAKGS